MDRFVAASYQGLSLGQGLQMDEFSGKTAFLHHPSPMPVGSSLLVEADETEIKVQVTKVGEQIAGTERGPGMFVEAVDLSGKAETWWAGGAGQEEETSDFAPEREFAQTEVMEAIVLEDSEPAVPKPENVKKPKKKKRRKKK